MNEAHRRFHAWLIAGAEGDPPRDLAVHASVCAGCQRSIDALDLLAGVNTGLASMPAEPIGRERGRLAVAGRLAGATAVLFSAAILGVGGSQLIGMSRHTNGGVAQASSTPNQNVLGGTATAQPTPEATATPLATPRETLTPLATQVPTKMPPVVTPIPRLTPMPTTVPTPSPLPSIVSTPSPSESVGATPTAAPSPTVPGAPTLISATPGVGVADLTWSAPSTDGGSAVSGYEIWRGTASGGETLLTTVGNVLNYQDTSASAGTYFYWVAAQNAVGTGPASNEASTTTT